MVRTRKGCVSSVFFNGNKNLNSFGDCKIRDDPDEAAQYPPNNKGAPPSLNCRYAKYCYDQGNGARNISENSVNQR